MFLYEVLFRQVPFYDTPNLLDVTELVAGGERPPILDDSLFDVYMEIFTKCWSADPSERLSLSEIVQRWNSLFSNSESTSIPDAATNNTNKTNTIEVHYGEVANLDEK